MQMLLYLLWSIKILISFIMPYSNKYNFFFANEYVDDKKNYGKTERKKNEFVLFNVYEKINKSYVHQILTDYC